MARTVHALSHAPRWRGLAIVATLAALLFGSVTLGGPALAASSTFTTPAPTIAGKAKVGEVLTATAGTASVSGTTPSYQWSTIDPTDSTATPVAIAGATGAMLELNAKQAGQYVVVSVTESKTGYLDNTQTSAKTAAVATGALKGAAGTPTVTGTATIGRTVTADPGAWFGKVSSTWAQPDATKNVWTNSQTLTSRSGNTKTVDYTMTYTWALNGVTLAGETGKTYTLARKDAGKKLTATVTVATADGGFSARATSAATPVALGTFTAMQIPIVESVVGKGNTLYADPGDWYQLVGDSDEVYPTFSYQWYRGTKKIAGATSVKYTTTTADEGKLLKVAVTAKATGFTPRTRVSAAALTFSTVTAPTISGKTVVGSKLTATVATWNPAATKYTYVWWRNGKVIVSESKTYTLTTKDKGAHLTVTVTGSKTGYFAVSTISKQTAVAAS